MPNVDPITFAVVRNKFISIANGMQETGFRTGVTTFMYEIMDCSFAILDAEAGVIARDGAVFDGDLATGVEPAGGAAEEEMVGDIISSDWTSGA